MTEQQRENNLTGPYLEWSLIALISEYTEVSSQIRDWELKYFRKHFV